MKSTKLFLIAVVVSALAASSAMARPSGSRTNSTGRNIQSAVRTSANHRAYNNNNWRHRHHRHHRHHSRISLSFGYPFGYGYPYYSSYPYGYGYYARPREVVYADTDDVDRRRPFSGVSRGRVIIAARSMASSATGPVAPFVRMSARMASGLMARSTADCSRRWASRKFPRE